MRILILGNMANNGYVVAKQLRSRGIDVELAINKSEFAGSFPEWEELEVDDDFDPFSTTRDALKHRWEAPSWIHEFDYLFKLPTIHSLFPWTKAFLNLRKLLKNYDIIEVHAPYSIYCLFSSVPYVVYDAGWVRTFAHDKRIVNKLAARSYERSEAIMMANPDTRRIFDDLGLSNKLVEMPYAIDYNKYAPSRSDSIRDKLCANSEEILLFSPSRQDWHQKRNDVMFRGYAKFSRHFKSSILVCVDWGIDLQRSKDLCASLGIANKIKWIKPTVKSKLIKMYNAADIILDQFGGLSKNYGGFYGAVTAEAMSCSKPVMCNVDYSIIQEAYGDIPPIINCVNEDDIHSNLIKLADSSLQRNIGQKSREWVMKHHSPEGVAQKHFEILVRLQKVTTTREYSIHT